MTMARKGGVVGSWRVVLERDQLDGGRDERPPDRVIESAGRSLLSRIRGATEGVRSSHAW